MSVDYGDPRLPERFWEKVYPEPNTGCWLWGAATSTLGYGSFHWQGTDTKAHRVAYMVLVGAVPKSLSLDHLCRVRWCVNAAHLEPVTHLINVRRGTGGQYNRVKTHCPSGHEYSDENTYRPPSTPTERQCRACGRDRKRNDQR